jgi:pyruvate/oxaloacetate carboxyltransferase
LRAHAAEVQGLKEKIKELQAEVKMRTAFHSVCDCSQVALSKAAEAAADARLDAAVSIAHCCIHAASTVTFLLSSLPLS